MAGGLLKRTTEQDVGAGSYLMPPQEILFGPRGGISKSEDRTLLYLFLLGWMFLMFKDYKLPIITIYKVGRTAVSQY